MNYAGQFASANFCYQKVDANLEGMKVYRHDGTFLGKVCQDSGGEIVARRFVLKPLSHIGFEQKTIEKAHIESINVDNVILRPTQSAYWMYPENLEEPM